ncbi:MAG: hypothetical protein ACHQQQ_03390 [Bacteroidota bacterium]
MENTTKMTPELQSEYTTLLQQTMVIRGKWKIFVQLYGTDNERVDLMNETAPTFFSILQGLLINDIILGFSRLTDSSRINKNNNMTLERLQNSIRNLGYDELSKSMAKKLEDLKKDIKGVRLIRDKKIAHNDYNTVLNDNASILPSVTFREIETMFRQIDDILDEVSLAFGETLSYKDVFMAGDGNAIIHFLKLAAAYIKRVENLQIDPDEDNLSI